MAMRMSTILPSARVALILVVAAAPWPVVAQNPLLPPQQVVRLVNAELANAALRLHSQGEWKARQHTFYTNDSWIRLLDATRAIPLEEVRLEPKSRFGIYYYYNANDIETDSIRLAHENGQYVLNLFFERGGPEIKGMCRWRRTNRDFTQCRPSGNDRPAPDVDFLQFGVRVPVVPEIGATGFSVRPRSCEAIDVRLQADISGLLGLGYNNLAERIAGRKLRGKIRDAICDMMGDPQAFRSTMNRRTGLRLASLPSLAHAGEVRPVRFRSGGALELVVTPAVLDASVGFEPAGGSCPQQVTARVAVATDRAREIRVRFQDGERTGPWIRLQSTPISLGGGGGGGGFAAVSDQPVGWKLGGGMHRLRMEVENGETTRWSRVNVTCATRTPPTTRAAVVPTNGPRKAGQCPLFVHFTGTLVIQSPGRYTYHFVGSDGSETEAKSFTANASGTTEVFWNRRIPATAPPGIPLPRTIGGWTQLVVRAEVGNQRPRSIHSDRAPFQVTCTNGGTGRPGGSP